MRLRLLDRIGIADPVRADADRLRADIQRELLAAASAGTPATTDTGRTGEVSEMRLPGI